MTARVPFPGASWNQKAVLLGAAPPEQQYRAERMYTYGGGTAPADEWRLAIDGYDVPQYDCWDHVKQKPSVLAPNRIRRVYQSVWGQNLFGQGGSFGGIKVGEWIPWNDKWEKPAGNDALIQVLNVPTIKYVESGPKKGQIATDASGAIQFDYSSCGNVNTQRNMGFFAAFDTVWNGSDFWGINGQNGFYQTDYNQMLICAACGITVGNFADDWYTRGYGYERGSGMMKLAGQVLMEELCDGVINHAMNLTLVNTMWMLKKGPKDGTEGKEWVGPARRAERLEGSLQLHTPGIVSDADPDHQTLHGTRVHLNKNYDLDKGIEVIRKRLVAMGVAKADLPLLLKSARVILTCAMEYGWICMETGGYGKHTETNGMRGPIQSVQAKAAGFKNTTLGKKAGTFLICGSFGAADLEVVMASKPGR